MFLGTSSQKPLAIVEDLNEVQKRSPGLDTGAEPVDWLETPLEDPEVQRIFTKLRGVPGDQYGLWVVFMYICTRDVGYLRQPLSTP